jgi:protein ImuA
MPLLESPEIDEKPVVSSGFYKIDGLFPRGGISKGSLIEWLGDDASGATTMASAVAVSMATTITGGTLFVVDRTGQFYPPAVMPWLSSTSVHCPERSLTPRLIIVRPSRDADQIWAIDQALRCSGVTVVLAWLGHIHPTVMRRWQLAARSSHAIGLLVRPKSMWREPTWAAHRLDVAPLMYQALTSRRFRLSLVDGPWTGADQLQGHKQSVEIVFDLLRGIEKVEKD